MELLCVAHAVLVLATRAQNGSQVTLSHGLLTARADLARHRRRRLVGSPTNCCKGPCYANVASGDKKQFTRTRG